MMKPKNYERRLVSPWSDVIIEPKIDGIRACYSDRMFHSYNGKPLYNIEAIVKELRTLPLHRATKLDGELWSESGGWEKTMSTVKSSKTVKALGDVKFYVFDMIPSSELASSQADMPLWRRKEGLARYFNANLKFVKLVSWQTVKTERDFLAAHQTYLELGYEGTMIKFKDGLYQWGKRSGAWLRLKPTTTEDVTIVGVKEGKGKYAGTLGALICVDQERRPICVSGMSDDMREWFWARHHRGLLSGTIVEVKYFKRTRQGNMYSAQFIRLRRDK